MSIAESTNKCSKCGWNNRSGARFCANDGYPLDENAAGVTKGEVGGLVGQQVGGWKVVRHIGRGGMGDVYLGQKTIEGREYEVVLKVPKTQNMTPEEQAQLRRLILDEAEAIRNLPHPNIVPFRDVIPYMGGTVLSMHFISGMDLGAYIRRTYQQEERRVKWDEMRPQAEGLLSALHYAHSHPLRPIVHGDIKPSNVQVESETGTAWLMDFGLARALRDAEVSVPIATMAYSPPEVLCGRGGGVPADIYAMGCTMYEWLSGFQPFPLEDRTNAEAQCEFIVHHRPRHLAQVRPDLPHDVADAVHKCLSVDRDKRFQDCSSMADALFSQTVQLGDAAEHIEVEKREPGSSFGIYQLVRKAFMGPFFETWFARTEDDAPVWLILFHQRISWPVLGAMKGTGQGISDGNLADVRSADLSFRPPYVVFDAQDDDQLLSEVLGRSEFSRERGISCALQVARGLKALHGEDRYHGLLSLDAVAFSPSTGRAVLLDTGFGRILRHVFELVDKRDLELYLSGLPYLAPEQAAGKEGSAAADVFAAGKLCLRLLSRRARVQDPISALADAGFERDVASLVMECLDEDVDVRFRTVEPVLHRMVLLTGEAGLSSGERDFVNEVGARVRAGKGAPEADALEDFANRYDIDDERALELLPQVIDSVGRRNWTRFVVPYRRRFLPIIRERSREGILHPEDRIVLESVRLEMEVPRLVARYLEMIPDQQEIKLAGLTFVRVPSGSYEMGSDFHCRDERPVHSVYLDKFLSGKFPVTRGQYMRFVAESGHREPATFNGVVSADGAPVSGVSWKDADAYCRWLSGMLARKVRLPTEAQWEFAARGGAHSDYPWGDQEPGGLRACFGDLQGTPLPVEQRLDGASPFGILDMAGNVWEWCRDWYHDFYYWESEDVNPRGPRQGEKRVLRGGSFMSPKERIRCSARDKDSPDVPLACYGFRVVID
jgi:formylglycine-generating enzyme required for sulfatase activity/serine/threonine protein kinase